MARGPGPIVERLRRIRMSWKRTERDEARIVLARLEQAWDAAVASGSAYLMLRVLRFQAELSGLTRPAGANRARLWPMPEEDELRGRDRLAGEERRCGSDPDDPDRTDDPDREDGDWFDSMEFASGHDIA